ncbi:MAG: hypothetical protein HXY49_01690 [Ignavibacteriaceae bacterium]|nr:hypothetical protein [Ignavibacteriaceae bacterium]
MKLFKNTIITGVLGILFLFTSMVKCQQDSLELLILHSAPNILFTNLSKQLNTYNLRSGFLYSSNTETFSLKVQENFNSSFIKSTTKNIRDEQALKIKTLYRINNNLLAGLDVLSNILSDNRRIEINQASVSSAILFAQYMPEEFLLIDPFFGYSFNRQIGEADNGYVYGSEALLNNYRLSDFNLQSALRFNNEDISPRKNFLRYINVAASKEFNQFVSNTFEGKFIQKRKDFYYTADSVTANEFGIKNNIQSRIETTYFLQNKLQLNQIFDLLDVNFISRLNWRIIDRDTRYRSKSIRSGNIFDSKIEELKLEVESATSYRSDFFSGTLIAIYSERDEKNITKKFEGIDESFFEQRSDLEKRKNNISFRSAIAFNGDLFISGNDRINISLFQSKLKYDTPSIENDDDRDEILSIARLRYLKKVSPFFEAIISAEGSISHVVYIFASRSSNNYINRTLKLSAGGIYSGSRLISRNIFEVSANYTVYDFEDINPNFQSFSFRQFSATDSTVLFLSKRMSIELLGFIKLSEQGDLKWAEFSTRPTRFVEEIFIESKIFALFNKLKTGIGVRFFALSNYNYKVKEKLIDSRYSSIGPLTEITYSVIEKINLRLYGWYEIISERNSLQREQANLNFELQWNF